MAAALHRGPDQVDLDHDTDFVAPSYWDAMRVQIRVSNFLKNIRYLNFITTILRRILRWVEWCYQILCTICLSYVKLIRSLISEFYSKITCMFSYNFNNENGFMLQNWGMHQIVRPVFRRSANL